MATTNALKLLYCTASTFQYLKMKISRVRLNLFLFAEKAKGERLAHSDSLSTSTVNWMKWVGWEGPRKIMNVTPFTKYVFKVWFRWERGSRVQGNCILYMITWVWLHLLRMFLHTLHFLTLCYFYQQNSFRVFLHLPYLISYHILQYFVGPSH